MNKYRYILAITGACGLSLWAVGLQLRLAGRERQLSQLEAKYQDLATQNAQAREYIESLARELSLRRMYTAESAGPRRPAEGSNSSATKALSIRSHAARAPGDGSFASLARWNLPPELASAITQRFGPAEITEMQPSIQKGQQVYTVRGTTADARSFGAMLAPDGTVLFSKSEVALDTIPVSVTSAFREIGGEANTAKARELYGPDGHLEYSLSGQAQDGRKVNLNLSADGQLTSGEIERSAGDLPEPVGKALAQAMANRSPSSVLEVFGGKGTFYEIGFADVTEHTQLVIDTQGRLVSFTSKANLQPDQPAKKSKL